MATPENLKGVRTAVELLRKGLERADE